MAETEKARRQQALLALVRSEDVGSQDELVKRLALRGHAVTQSTLSRDLKELRVLRVPENDGYRYVPAGDEAVSAAPPAVTRVAAFEVTGVEANEVSVVVRTLVGHAQGVAVHLDGLAWPEVLGTIAGDDTILVLPRSTKKTGQLRSRLAELFGLQLSEAASGS